VSEHKSGFRQKKKGVLRVITTTSEIILEKNKKGKKHTLVYETPRRVEKQLTTERGKRGGGGGEDRGSIRRGQTDLHNSTVGLTKKINMKGTDKKLGQTHFHLGGSEKKRRRRTKREPLCLGGQEEP